nr:unnamed protein product [Rangifer tarandus platyrhynchus]
MREQDLTQGDVTLTQGRALHTQLAAGAVYPAGREELDGQVSRHTAEARAALFGSVQINTAKECASGGREARRRPEERDRSAREAVPRGSFPAGRRPRAAESPPPAREEEEPPPPPPRRSPGGHASSGQAEREPRSTGRADRAGRTPREKVGSGGRAAGSGRGRAPMEEQAWGPRPPGGFQAVGRGRKSGRGRSWTFPAGALSSRGRGRGGRGVGPTTRTLGWARTGLRGRASADLRPAAASAAGPPRRDHSPRLQPHVPGVASPLGTGVPGGRVLWALPLMLGVGVAAVSRAPARLVPDSCRFLCFRTSCIFKNGSV